MKVAKKGYETNIYDIEELERDYPGPITNDQLLKDPKKYLRDDDPNDQTNFILKKKFTQGIDYKLLPRKCWEILKNRFRGIEIVRFKDTGYYSVNYLIRLPVVSLFYNL